MVLRPADQPTAAAGLLSLGLFQESIDEELAMTAPEGEAPRVGRGRDRRGRQVVSAAPFRGRYLRAVPAKGSYRDLAWRPTLLSAARGASVRAPGDLAASLGIDDLQRKERLARPPRLLLLLVDASGSMGGVLTRLARRIALGVLRDAYLKRSKVAMIAFRERSAELLFPPTRKLEQIHRVLDALPVGGTTPLAGGLALTHAMALRESRRDRGQRMTILLVSDGRANVGSRQGHERVMAEVEQWARRIAALPGVPVLHLDTTEDGTNDSPARELSAWLGAERIPLSRPGAVHSLVQVLPDQRYFSV